MPDKIMGPKQAAALAQARVALHQDGARADYARLTKQSLNLRQLAENLAGWHAWLLTEAERDRTSHLLSAAFAVETLGRECLSTAALLERVSVAVTHASGLNAPDLGAAARGVQ